MIGKNFIDNTCFFF